MFQHFIFDHAFIATISIHCIWETQNIFLVSFVDIDDASQHVGSVMSVWAFQQVPECAIDYAFVATIISLHSESPKEIFFVISVVIAGLLCEQSLLLWVFIFICTSYLVMLSLIAFSGMSLRVILGKVMSGTDHSFCFCYNNNSTL